MKESFLVGVFFVSAGKGAISKRCFIGSSVTAEALQMVGDAM
jgi:hypothetical protein